MRQINRQLAAVVTGAFLLVGCGFGGVAEQVREVGDALEEIDAEVGDLESGDAATEVEDGDNAGSADDAADSGVIGEDPGLAGSAEDSVPDAAGEDQDSSAATDQPLEVEVSYNGLVYSFTAMSTVEHDDGNRAEITFDVDVHNLGTETMMPSAPVALRWNEPNSDNTIEVNGQADFRQVPGGSSASGAIVVQLLAADYQAYDEHSARLIIGSSGQSAAEAPIGEGAELVDRAPVPQPDLAGKQLQLDDLTVTISAADLRWDGPNGPIADGEAIVEFEYTMDNTGEAQICAHRGEGRNFALTRADGEGFVDLRVGERCVRGGQSEDSVTGILITEPLAGEYTLTHTPDGEREGETTFELVAPD